MTSVNPTWVLTVASLKMWFRNRQAIFWTFFLPLVLMVIFGILNFGDLGDVDLAVIDLADTEGSLSFVESLRGIETFDVSTEGTEEEGRLALSRGDRDLLLIIPEGFGRSKEPVAVIIYYNEGQPGESQVGRTIVRQLLDEMTFAMTDVPRRFTIDAQPVSSRNLRYIDFLMPGIVAMSIMQMGLFSVAFAFVQLKSRGILRRLLATPVHPGSFLFGQVLTRLTVSIIQTVVLVGVAVVFFNVHVAGSLAAILLLAVLGGGVFVSMGFAVSGWAKSEEVAAPVANIIALPMMFLSGVFFPREAMPGPVESVTDFLPLTYLADALRSIAIDGEPVWSQWGDIAGLAAWLAISFTLAVRLFRWE